MGTRSLPHILLAMALAVPLSAATPPSVLTEVNPGQWELSGLPGTKAPVRQCIASTAELAQVEHRGKSCTRVIIKDSAAAAVIHYTCAGGGFGQSKMTLITPRSLRIETQGISDGLPFNYVLQARHMGLCPSH